MRIGELARRSGVGVETIRFYESKGLLQPARRLTNNYRDYTEEHLARLHFIRHCRALDIALEDIGRLASAAAPADERFEGVHALIDEKLAAVGERIAELKILQDKLLELKSSCCGHHAGGGRCAILEGLSAYDREGCGCCRHFQEAGGK